MCVTSSHHRNVKERKKGKQQSNELIRYKEKVSVIGGETTKEPDKKEHVPFNYLQQQQDQHHLEIIINKT